jgi:protein CpxP
MKTIKTLFVITVFAFVATIGSASAQETAKKEHTPEEIAQHQTNKLTKELALTADQQKSVYDINLNYAQQNSELRKSIRLAKKNMDKRDDELKALLNDQQKQQLDSLRGSQREKFKQARQERKSASQSAE